ncbi:MAG: hypothetical protein AAFR93_13970, partial [Pseudomonadota bacterium]
VRHTFTHFHLQLTVMAAPVAQAGPGFQRTRAGDLPTVFAKAFRLGRSCLETQKASALGQPRAT